MDPALIKEKEAFFKKRANVEPAKKKSSAKVRLPSRPIESKKPKKKRVDNGGKSVLITLLPSPSPSQLAVLVFPILTLSLHVVQRLLPG